MSIWELRHYIEARTPWWVPFATLGAVGLFYFYVWFFRDWRKF